MSKSLTTADLAQFSGSTVWYRHAMIRSILFTEGIHYMASTANAYWLIDEVAFAQVHPKVGRESFQSWSLRVKNRTGRLIGEDGNGRTLFRKWIFYTDFPLEELTMYCCDNVIMLPGEY